MPKSTNNTIIMFTVGIGVILGLSALVVLPLQNQAFADSQVGGSASSVILTCPDGHEEAVDFFNFFAEEQGGEWSGNFHIEGLNGQMHGLLDKGTLTPSGNLNFRGSVVSDTLCRDGAATPYNMHISGECGDNVDIKFRTEEGETGTWSGSVRCISS